MKTRAVLALTIVAGMATAASAQPTATVTLNWKNLATGAADPLNPGQSAAIWANVAFTPAVGTQIGNGNVAGLGSLFMDLIGSNGGQGTWTLAGAGFNGTPNIDGPFTNTNATNFGRRNDLFGGWGLGSPGIPGNTTAGGTDQDLMAAQAGQFPLSPPANSFNPVREIWRTGWAPDSYTNRVVTFDSRKADASPNTGVSILVLLPGDIHETIHVPSANITWGSVNIPIVPSPSSLALLGLGGLVVARRRR